MKIPGSPLQLLLKSLILHAFTVVLEVKKLSAATTTKRKWEREMTLDEERAEGNSAEGEVCEIRLLSMGDTLRATLAASALASCWS